MSKNECLFTPFIFAVNENDATLSACICNGVQRVHRHMNQSWCIFKATLSYNAHQKLPFNSFVNAAVEEKHITIPPENCENLRQNCFWRGFPATRIDHLKLPLGRIRYNFGSKIPQLSGLPEIPRGRARVQWRTEQEFAAFEKNF